MQCAAKEQEYATRRSCIDCLDEENGEAKYWAWPGLVSWDLPYRVYSDKSPTSPVRLNKDIPGAILAMPLALKAVDIFRSHRAFSTSSSMRSIDSSRKAFWRIALCFLKSRFEAALFSPSFRVIKLQWLPNDGFRHRRRFLMVGFSRWECERANSEPLPFGDLISCGFAV